MTGEDDKIQPGLAKTMTRRTFYETAGRIGVGVTFGADALALEHHLHLRRPAGSVGAGAARASG
jgi:hypothetical protein